ncbi:hypothetical protein [Fredinandcohnia onubensis]|uniref:hypothetical protein n=1 Tax=Fredinandcohnia onubensis TaxID=1571209 RepID=UPI0015D50FA0|nr:hypothetical protein [Fredinandcohnia onubensis]
MDSLLELLFKSAMKGINGRFQLGFLFMSAMKGITSEFLARVPLHKQDERD